MPPAGLETVIPASERPQTHALDRTATGIGTIFYICDVSHKVYQTARYNFSVIQSKKLLSTYASLKSIFMSLRAF